MNPVDEIKAIQTLLNVTADGIPGSQTESAWQALKLLVQKVPVWPWKMSIDGDDLVSPLGTMTCFGGWGSGISDPMDNGNTSSGLNTRTQSIEGVSVAMDGRMFSMLSPAVHRALDGAPIPRLLNDFGLTAWHTQVEVTIGGIKFTPKDGIVDLGPGLQASKPGSPHILDLTVPAAAIVKPNHPNSWYANNFEVQGSYRVIGGAKLAGLA